MKALTICQPYAHLVIHGEKLCENRRWATNYRGELIIHAGKSHGWMRPADYRRFGRPLTFGALLGVVTVTACYQVGDIQAGRVPEHHRWLRSHLHVGGPMCIIVEHPRRFATPIPFRGAQGLFDVADEVVASVKFMEV